MLFLLHLFRRNAEARRARWFVFGVAAGSLVIALAYEATRPAHGADAETCSRYGASVERLVKLATNDDDVAQAARERGAAWCFVIDEPPLIISDERGTTPAADAPKPAPSPKDAWCRHHYGSYRPSDSTVLRRGAHRRSACPWPG